MIRSTATFVAFHTDDETPTITIREGGVERTLEIQIPGDYDVERLCEEHENALRPGDEISFTLIEGEDDEDEQIIGEIVDPRPKIDSVSLACLIRAGADMKQLLEGARKNCFVSSDIHASEDFEIDLPEDRTRADGSTTIRLGCNTGVICLAQIEYDPDIDVRKANPLQLDGQTLYAYNDILTGVENPKGRPLREVVNLHRGSLLDGSEIVHDFQPEGTHAFIVLDADDVEIERLAA